jgi:DNA-directed RNA polymerase subunit RPC12/RpoP
MKCKSCGKGIDTVFVLSIRTQIAPIDENRAVDLETAEDIQKTKEIVCRKCFYNLSEVVQG